MNSYNLSAPTYYNGQPYRSQAEAHWARLFSELRVSFMYEPHTFELPDGTIYNPDFYIPKTEKYIEIKNYMGSQSLENTIKDATKINTLARCIGKHTLLIDGRPANATAYVFDGTPPELDNIEHIEQMASRKIITSGNPVAILSEIVQPPDAAANTALPRNFTFGIKQRVKNLSIPPNYDMNLQRQATQAELTAQNAHISNRDPIKLTEPK
jgi:hypothetical protein